MIIKLAWRNLWRNRKRTIITSSSVVFAVLLAISLNSVKEGMLVKMQENIVSFYSGAIQVHQNGYWDDQTINNTFEENGELMESLASHENVTAIVPRLESFALTASEENSRGVWWYQLILRRSTNNADRSKALFRLVSGAR